MGWGLRNGMMRGMRLRMAWEGGRVEDRFGHEKMGSRRQSWTWRHE